ncbi:hypothetical protein O9929_12560 [Vibrio lentus]|nr:hypothetical protein [Vibrio lentus]
MFTLPLVSSFTARQYGARFLTARCLLVQVAVLPLMILFAISSRQLIAGSTSGAVKG